MPTSIITIPNTGGTPSTLHLLASDTLAGTGTAGGFLQGLLSTPFSAAEGASATGLERMLIGGKDSSGNVRSLLCGTDGQLTTKLVAGDSSGALVIGTVLIGGTPTFAFDGLFDVSGTVTALDGGTSWGDPTHAPFESNTLLSTPIAITAPPNNGQKRKVTEVYVSSDENIWISLNWEGSGAFHKVYLAARQPYTMVPREPLLGPTGNGSNASLFIAASANTTNNVFISTRSYSVA